MSQKECFKTKIGGQAVIEGIAMRGPKQTCLAVREPNGEIHTELFETKSNPLKKIPLLRGAAAMIVSLLAGYGYIMRAADIAYPEESETESANERNAASDSGGGSLEAADASEGGAGEKSGAKNDKGAVSSGWIGVVSGLLGVALAIGLFILIPTLLTTALNKLIPLGAFKSVVEGVIKLIMFVGYLFAVTRIPDIHRVFEYHGAEHKTIACYEHRGELTPEGVRPFSRFHPRCGTSFLFITIILSIIVSSFMTWDNVFVRMALKLLCLPLIMGVSYEIIQYSGAHDNALSRILSAPGLWIQRLTSFEPSDEQLEVAIASLLPVLPQNEAEAEWSAQ